MRSHFIALSLLALVVASGCAKSDATDSENQSVRALDTELVRIEKPHGAITVYSLYSTRDGRVLTVDPTDPGNRNLVAKLDDLIAADTRRPVHLVIQGEDEVIGLTEMSPSEAKLYSDDLSHLPDSALRAEIDGDAPAVRNSNAANSFEGPAPAAMDEARASGYEPTVLGSMAEAERLFSEEAPLQHDSQCHERAMIWAVDMYKSRRINSMKVMMFYSKRFQNTYIRVGRPDRIFKQIKPYKWWYHTAPFVYVGSQEIVLDSEFLKQPVTLDQWTHYFLSEFISEYSNVLQDQNPQHDWRGYLTTKDGDVIKWNDHPIPLAPRLTEEQTKCRVMERYQNIFEFEGDEGHDPSWCMVRKLPMYYFDPQSFEMRDCNPETDHASTSSARFPDGRFRVACKHEAPRTWFDKFSMEAIKKVDRRDR
jgi:hypothetical protein